MFNAICIMHSLKSKALESVGGRCGHSHGILHCASPFLLARATLETSGDKKPEFDWHQTCIFAVLVGKHTFIHKNRPNLESPLPWKFAEFQTSSSHFPAQNLSLVPSHNAFSNRAHTVSTLRRMALEVPQRRLGLGTSRVGTF